MDHLQLTMAWEGYKALLETIRERQHFLMQKIFYKQSDYN